jgi:aspartyl-tRNA(Asn)/glutamyl-tRNA(Gln) amidotransferase subunit A
MARTAADCLVMWTAMTGGRPHASTAAGIAWIPPDSVHPTAPAVTRAARDFAGDLVTGEVSIPHLRELRAAYGIIQGSEAYAVHAERLESAPELYGEEVRDRLRAGGEFRGWEYARALDLRKRVHSTVMNLLRAYAFLALPTIPLLAPPLDRRADRIGAEPIDVPAALLALTSPWSVLGLPAVSIPAGFVDGLPTALQLVGPPGSEQRLLATAGRLQRTTS